MENEIASHEKVLNTVDEILMPNAQDEQLRQLLEEIRPTLVSHLEQAKQVREALGGMAMETSG